MRYIILSAVLMLGSCGSLGSQLDKLSLPVRNFSDVSSRAEAIAHAVTVSLAAADLDHDQHVQGTNEWIALFMSLARTLPPAIRGQAAP